MASILFLEISLARFSIIMIPEIIIIKVGINDPNLFSKRSSSTSNIRLKNIEIPNTISDNRKMYLLKIMGV